ncbi:nuclear transport factor 2 family protein [Sphingobacterium detergens]|jgi:hypothetical protein|nr:hypothetical protein [Sphingobacterium sp.]
MKNLNHEDLIAIVEIKKVMARYTRFVDTKQWNSFKELFDENAHMLFEGEKGERLFEFNSPQEMVNVTAPVLEGARSAHHVHSPEIELLPEHRATAIWAMEDLINFAQREEIPYKKLHGFGHYHLELLKTEQGWKITRLQLKRTILDILV